MKHYPPYPPGLEANEARSNQLVTGYDLFHVTVQGHLPDGCIREAIVVAEGAQEAIGHLLLYALLVGARWPHTADADVIASFAGRPCRGAFNEAKEEGWVLVAKREREKSK